MRRVVVALALLFASVSIAPAAAADGPAVTVYGASAHASALRALVRSTPVRGGNGTVAERYVAVAEAGAVVLDARRAAGTLVGVDVHALGLDGELVYLGSAVADLTGPEARVHQIDASGVVRKTDVVAESACSSNCNLVSAVAGGATSIACGALVTVGGLGGPVGFFVGVVGCSLVSGIVGYVVSDNCETAEMCAPVIKWTQLTCGFPGCQGLGFIVSPFRLTPVQDSWAAYPDSGNYLYTAASSFFFRQASAGLTEIHAEPSGNTEAPFLYTFSHFLFDHPFACPDDSFATVTVRVGGGGSDPMTVPVVGGCDGLR